MSHSAHFRGFLGCEGFGDKEWTKREINLLVVAKKPFFYYFRFAGTYKKDRPNRSFAKKIPFPLKEKGKLIFKEKLDGAPGER